MARYRRRPVITGVGLVTPLGIDLGPNRTALREGQGGVRPVRSFDASALPTRFGAEVLNFDARDFLERKERKRLNQMVRTIQFAVAAAQLAVRDGGVEQGVERGVLDPTRFGVCFGTGTIPSELLDLGPAAQASVPPGGNEVDLRKWGEQSIATIPPLWMLSHVPNMPASHISILHNAQGPNNTVTQTDVSGPLALGEACRALERDQADILLVGGADAKINAITMVRQCLFAPLSRRNDEPERASRPFDRQRDGIVLGEGAGVLVLEALDHAQKRGARIYAELVGFGAAFDRARSGQGLARAVRTALEMANIGPDDLDHVNAQGYSAVLTDVWEAQGLREALGDHADTVPVFAAKSYFGNLGAGSGPVELAISLLALGDGVLPATLNYEEPDPLCPIAVNAMARPVTKPYFLKVSLTEQGQCAAVVCRKFT